MEVILLERVAKLGQMGETVRVRDGYARNYLLPRAKALRATKANTEHFEKQRAQLEARNLERRSEAEKVGAELGGKSFMIIRQAGDTGVLYGSVAPRDLAEIVEVELLALGDVLAARLALAFFLRAGDVDRHLDLNLGM